MKNKKTFLIQFWIDLKLFFREPLYVSLILILPAIFFLIFASMYSGESYGNMNYFQKYIPGFVSQIMYATTIFSVGVQLVIDKEQGVFRMIKASPVKMKNIFGVVIIKGYFICIIGLLEIIAIAKFVFKSELTEHWGVFAIAFLYATTVLLIIGFLVSCAFDNLKTAIAVLMITFYPVFFLSDANIPLNILPQIMQKIAIINPLYHINIILREAWSGKFIINSSENASFIYLMIISIICIWGSYILLKKDN